ncbi:MAG: thiamine pyrophosphate-binding protein, partial [Paracoccaceae bacterium]
MSDTPSQSEFRAESRAADKLARRLYAAGCRYAFGMPGGEVLTIVDALERAGIRFVLAKHENAAGFMAEGVHHTDGAPAILVATVGPGALNCVNVTANAEQDRVPMIVLTGCVDSDEELTYTHQILDHQAVYRPITRATFKLTADSADIVADKAVSIAMTPRCGPVHIDVPISVADAVRPDRVTPETVPTGPVAPTGTALSKAREWLAGAERPIAIIGLDVLRDGSDTVLRAFLEHFSIPFITTYKAKGVLREDHPLCLGAAGLSPKADTQLMPLGEQAGLILARGDDPIEMSTRWRNPWGPPKQKAIGNTALPKTPPHHPATMELLGGTG